MQKVNIDWLKARLPTRFSVPGFFFDCMGASLSQILEEALDIAEVGKIKLIPKSIYEGLLVRGVFGRGLGFSLALVPTAIDDANKAGLFVNPIDGAAWKRFAVHSARDQSGNVAGIVASEVIVGVALLAGFSAAPVLILVGLAAGIAGAAIFNAMRANEAIGNQVQKAID